MKRDIYQEVTNTLIEMIENKPGEFKMPWHSKSKGLAMNIVSGHVYRGINQVMLGWLGAQLHGFTDTFYATYQQWQSVGAQVKRGSKGLPVIFYTTVPATREVNGKEEEYAQPIAKWSTLFNVAQVDNYYLPEQKAPDLADMLEHAETFVNNTGADVRHTEQRAYYVPSKDFINIPDRKWFIDTKNSSATENYYSTLFHELTHWTRHKSRLDRDFGQKRFGDNGYAMEELVAELGAAFMCAELRIANEPRKDHAQYLANWLDVLKSDKKALFTAAAKANQAVEYLSGLQVEEQRAA